MPKMKFLKQILTLLFCVMTFNCSDDDAPMDEPIVEEQPNIQPEDSGESNEPETEIYFEAIVGNDFNTEISDNWLIIHDEDGNLIDFKPFEKNDTLRFEKPKEKVLDKFTITTFWVGTLTGRAPFTIRSYPDVPKGSNWVIGILNYVPPSYLEPEILGSFDVTVSGKLISPSMRVISNILGSEIGNGAYSISTNNSNGDWVYKKTVDLLEDNDYYLTFMNPLGDAKYYYLQDVKNQSVFDLDYDLLSDFDSYINMELPVTSKIYFRLRGYKDTPTVITSPGYDFYRINSEISGQGINPSFELGYLGNTFETYSFYLTAILEDYTYSYNFFGAELPSSIIVPKRPNFSIDNANIHEFKITTDLDYKRRISSWTSAQIPSNSDERITNWFVFASPSTTSIIGNLPDEITSNYPEMDVSKLVYESSSIFIEESANYSEFLEAYFKGEDYVNSFRSEKTFYIKP